MEGNAQQKNTPLARELTKIFSSYNKHSVQLKKNLKETHAFFREIRQNYSNACASAITDSASLEAGRSEALQHLCIQHWITTLNRWKTYYTYAIAVLHVWCSAESPYT